MQCNEFGQLIDAYLDDELLVETNNRMLRHLEDCAGCRSRLASRRALGDRLRHAVRNAPGSQADPHFLRRAEADIRRQALSPGRFAKIRESMAHQGYRLAAAAAVLVIAIGAIAILIQYRTQRIVTSDQAGIEVGDTAPRWRAIAQKASGDHKNCAVAFHLTEKPISLHEAAARFGAFNEDIDKAVAAASETDGAVVIEAHNCLYAGRRFAHIVLRKDGKLISVLVTDTDGTLPGGETGEPDVAGFTVGQFAVFVVSDLGADVNRQIAGQVEPALRGHLSRYAV